MAAALLTGIVASLAGIAGAMYLGLTWTSTGMLGQHISIGIFSTMITLFAHSMMMFYFLGKGKAVREAAAEGGLSREYERRIASARTPPVCRSRERASGPVAVAMPAVWSRLSPQRVIACPDRGPQSGFSSYASLTKCGKTTCRLLSGRSGRATGFGRVNF